MPFQPTAEQQAIIDHDPRRHGRVLAGPGTGKSATVVALVERLLTEQQAPKIRLVTFTRAATAELAQKVAGASALEVERPSTIHSFAISSLLKNPGAGGHPQPLRIADDWDMAQIVRPQLAALTGVRPTDVKNQLLPEMAAAWESLEPGRDPDVPEELRNRFLGAFQEHRRVFGYTLLAELPFLLRSALETHDDLVGLDYDLLVVDEYQDLNACDLSLLELLSQRGVSIFGVGDDEQSIYGFRRAAPEGIRRFCEDYPGAADYQLTVSHRSGFKIVRWARHVIEADPRRAVDSQRLVTPAGAATGETAFLAFPSQVTEARGVADLVEHLIQREKIKPADIVIMARGDHNGHFSNPIKKELSGRGIVVHDPTWVDAVLGEPASRKVLLLARLLCDQGDSLAWAGLLCLTAGIGAGFRMSTFESAREEQTTFAAALLSTDPDAVQGAEAGVARKARAVVDQTLAWLGEHPPPEGLEKGTWGDWLRATFTADAPAQISQELDKLLAIVDDEAGADLSLGRYLGQIQPLAKDHAVASVSGVRFMSMAMSKGLTVEASIIIGAEEGIVPYPEADVHEERRLLYVAMTRARRHNFVTMARRRTGPTARSGTVDVQGRRRPTRFLSHGPVRVRDGPDFIKDRWPAAGGKAATAA